MTQPQITLTLSKGGLLNAEAPGKNGSRRKLDIVQGDNIYDTLRAAIFELAEELLDQARTEQKRAQEEAERQRALERARHVRIVEHTAAHYPSMLKHIDPRLMQVTAKMHEALRRDGYTDNEIKLMASRGELVGTKFFTMPRDLRQAQTTRAQTPKLDKKADFARQVAEAIPVAP